MSCEAELVNLKMAKLDFDNGVEGPPTKKQKISPADLSNVTTTQPTQPDKTAKMDDRKTHLAVVDNGFQPERETQVGILCFVNSDNPGFSGTLKQRYVFSCHSLSLFILEACSLQSMVPHPIFLFFKHGSHNGMSVFPHTWWLWSPWWVPRHWLLRYLHVSQLGTVCLDITPLIFKQTSTLQALANPI